MGTYRDLNDYEIMYMVEESDEARDLLFDKYRPIIVNIANKYRLEAKKLGLELDDLIQEGYLGLYSAIRNYNPNENTLFYTYALLSIRSKIFNCLKMHNCQKYQSLNTSVSLSKPVFNDDELSLIDYVVDKNAISPDEVLAEFETINSISDFLYTLDINLACLFELNLNGFSNADISRLLDISCKTVANNLFRVRKKLNQYYNFVH